jgi:hypothetical protein
VESLALSLITPPNFGGGGGSCFPSSEVVALGVPGIPVIFWSPMSFSLCLESLWFAAEITYCARQFDQKAESTRSFLGNVRLPF